MSAFSPVNDPLILPVNSIVASSPFIFQLVLIKVKAKRLMTAAAIAG